MASWVLTLLFGYFAKYGASMYSPYFTMLAVMASMHFRSPSRDVALAEQAV
jgi:hypothetical protein